MSKEWYEGNIQWVDFVLGLASGVVLMFVVIILFSRTTSPADMNDLDAIENCNVLLRYDNRASHFIECLETNGLRLVKK